jgi:ABC-type branched-subunit amino acid transport system permease subunit
MRAFVSFLVVGLSVGLIYTLLALGMVLIYKGTRILNFAHPYFGLLAAMLTWWMTSRASFPPFSWIPFELDSRPRFILCAVIALAIVALNGWSIEHNLIRRMRRAPRVVLLVLTIALAQGTVGFVALLFFRTEEQATTFKRLPSLFRFTTQVGGVPITGEHFLVLIVTVVIGVVATWFFTRTKFGVAIRAAAENPDAARLLGISADRVSSFVWIVGSVLAGIAGILIILIIGTLDINTLGAGFLVRGLAAVLVGGLTSIPGALAGGMSVGIIEWLIKWQWPDRPGPPETVLFIVVILILLIRGFLRKLEQAEDHVAFVPTIKALPSRLRNSSAAKGVKFMAVIPIAILVLISLTSGSYTNGVLVVMTVYAIVGVSLIVLTGYTGQISLGHWGLAGVGAFGLANFHTRLGLPYGVSLLLVIPLGMLVSLIIGLPALRIRGLYLAITTLAFNLAVEVFVFNLAIVGGTSAGIHLNAPQVGPIDFGDPSYRPLFFFGLFLLGLCVLVARNLARTRTGRSFYALRENEKAASTFGVALTRYKLLAFALSGGMAALAGGLFATYLEFAEATTWTTAQSFILVSMVMIGGLGSLWGPLFGSFLLIAVPRLARFENPWIVPIATGILLLIVIVRFRGGIAGLILAARDRVVEGLHDLSQPVSGAPPPAPAGPESPR